MFERSRVCQARQAYMQAVLEKCMFSYTIRSFSPILDASSSLHLCAFSCDASCEPHFQCLPGYSSGSSQFDCGQSFMFDEVIHLAPAESEHGSYLRNG